MLATGCLYLFTSSSKASRSPRCTRSISSISGSTLAAMGRHVNKNQHPHKVATFFALPGARHSCRLRGRVGRGLGKDADASDGANVEAAYQRPRGGKSALQ